MCRRALPSEFESRFPVYFPTETLPFWITKFWFPEAVADAPVFFTVTVRGPLPRSRVDEPAIEVCAVDEHFTTRSCELESRLISFTAKAAGAATASMQRRERTFILPKVQPPPRADARPSAPRSQPVAALSGKLSQVIATTYRTAGVLPRQARFTLAVWALLCLCTGRFCGIPPAIQKNEATFFRLGFLGQWSQAIDNK
jgi:hypothetical protein